MYAEVKRNTNEKTGKYSFTYAQMCADVRKERMKMPRKMLPELVNFICERLREGWSPEEIEGYLPSECQTCARLILHFGLETAIGVKNGRAEKGAVPQRLRHSPLGIISGRY